MFSHQAPERQTSTATSQTFVWDSSQDDLEKVQCEPVELGWNVDVSTVHYTLTHEEGDKGSDWFDLGNESTLAAACWRFKTLHKVLGTSGKISAVYNYTRYKNVLAEQTRAMNIPLTWGMQQVVSFDSAESWVLTYNRFDGSVIQLAGASSDDPYLKVSTAGATISLQTVP